MSETQISSSIQPFFIYMKNTDAYLLQGIAPNQVWNRFNWLSQEQTDWHNFAVQAAAYKVDYDAKLVNMTNLRGKIHKLIQQVRNYAHQNHNVERIATQAPSLAVLEDFTTFHIVHNIPLVGSGLPTERKAGTTKVVVVECEPLPNGDMKFTCKVSATNKHAGKLKHYNIGVLYKELANADTSVSPAVPAEKDPTSTNELTQFVIETHARFTMHLGSDASNHRLAMSFYWKHITNPALDGPKSKIQIFTII